MMNYNEIKMRNFQIIKLNAEYLYYMILSLDHQIRQF